MKKMILSLLVLNVTTLFTSAALADVHPLTVAIPAIRSNNALGLKLAREAAALELNEKSTISNQMYSPLSLYNAVSMLQMGLSGQTKQDLDATLNWNPSINTHALNKTLNSFLSQERELTHTCTTCPRAPVVGIKNAAWSTNGQTTAPAFVFSSSYKTDLQSYYQAKVRSLDFKDAATADIMNDWAKENTNGLIPHVITADIVKDLMWVLMNATYVEANWADSFYALPAEYAPEFETAAGAKIKTDMISSTQSIATVDLGQFQIAEIPFYASDLSFFVVLPKSNAEFQRWVQNGETLEPAFWTSTFQQLNQVQVQKTEILMPKFSFASSIEMQQDSALTEKMGLGFLFNGKRGADFAPMGTKSSPYTVVGLIKQDNKIELDEMGVKAAAVTLIGGIEATSAPVSPTAKLTVDRPFFYAIGSKTTGVLIFVGAVADPRAN